MNLLRTIIDRLNQRIEVANIFDKQFGLCELNANNNDKAWVHYIGNGQAEVVTNFDAKNGTLFWAKRSKVTVNKTDAYKMSGCKQLYVTSFPLTAYAIVKKSHLPCDSEDAQDWLASRIYKLTSGTDPLFKQSIGVINYEVVPSGYINEIKTLTANYEWACVSVDFDVQIITSSEDGCYDTCATGDIPLPDLQPCSPCLTEVAVDGVTIIGNGTPADPLSAIGGATPAISIADAAADGTTKGAAAFTATDFNAASGVISIDYTNGQAASGSTNGFLISADWTTFNGKQAALVSGTNIKTINYGSILGSGNIATPFEFVVAASDEGTALTTGTAKITFRMPRAVTLTAVRVSLTTAQASGSIFTVDINEEGTSILSTKLTIDNTEKTSATAATPPVISDTALADDAEITIDIDQIGNGTAKGLKVMLIGTYA